MENILKYIISFRYGGSYFRWLIGCGILKHDIRGYYLDAELLDFDLRVTTDKLYELYGIEIKRVWMPDGFYCLEYDPGFGREIWVYEDDRYRRWELKGYNRGTI